MKVLFFFFFLRKKVDSPSVSKKNGRWGRGERNFEIRNNMEDGSKT